jgi:hypothetical protein
MLKIISDKIIFHLFEMVRENRSLDAMNLKLQHLSIPGLLCMIVQPVRTIPGLADVHDLLRAAIIQDIEARAGGSSKGSFPVIRSTRCDFLTVRHL